MARQPRLSVPGVMHYVQQRGHNGGAIARDAHDSERLLQTLREAARSHGVLLHAYAITAGDLRVLATPDSADGISRMMQALGRRHAAAFNRRHGRTGALWDGRFRSALIESGPASLLALRHIEAAHRADLQDSVDRSSLAHRLGGRRDGALVDPPAFWQLGNTPFERELHYRQLLDDTLPAQDEAAIADALRRGWALGSPAFLHGLAADAQRPLQPRPRGRPRRDA